MKHFFHYTATAVATMSNAVLGHMWLASPARFSFNIDNSPLVGPGAGASDYPCKFSGQSGFYDTTQRTEIGAGSTFPVQFTGQAVHGGGSCQFALTKSLAPDKSSVFKVVHSIQGGCPARGTPGNMGDDRDAADPFAYPFVMPADIDPGQYTFAWTWFNKVGNREMYMNCAPITVTAGGGPKSKRDSAFFDSLPNLVLANIPDVDCAGPGEGTGVFQFPEPGASVENNAGDGPLAALVPKMCYSPVGNTNAIQVPGGSDTGAGAGSGGSASTAGSSGVNTATVQSSATSIASATPTSVASVASVTISPIPALTPAYTASSGFATVTTSASTATATATSSSNGPANVPPGRGGGAGTGGGSGSNATCPAGQQQCSTNGAVVCIGDNKWGLCNWGCAVPEALSSGTVCMSGTIMDARVRYHKRRSRSGHGHSAGHAAGHASLHE